jgi:hypothetical protein
MICGSHWPPRADIQSPHCINRTREPKNPIGEEQVERVLVIRGPMAEEAIMDGIIYLVGLIVIIMAILSFFGLR